MKKLIALLLAMILVFSLASCRNDKENGDDDTNDVEDALNGDGALETPIIDWD